VELELELELELYWNCLLKLYLCIGPGPQVTHDFHFQSHLHTRTI